MLYVLRDYIVYINALYAKEENSITYSEISEYKTLLYRELKQKYKYIMFDSPEEKIIEIKNHTFIKANEEVLSVHELEEEFIADLNSVYPEEFQEIIDKSRKEYKEKTLQKRKSFYEKTNKKI